MILNPEELETMAAAIIHVDGDRDEEATSNLTCEQTIAIANFLRALAREVREGPLQ